MTHSGHSEWHFQMGGTSAITISKKDFLKMFTEQKCHPSKNGKMPVSLPTSILYLSSCHNCVRVIAGHSLPSLQ